MEFFHIKRDIPFMRYAGVTSVVSAITFVLAVAAIAIRGLNLSIDFTGGTVLEVHYQHAVAAEQVRQVLAEGGYPAAMVQNFGTTRDVLIRLQDQSEASSTMLAENVFSVLRQQDATVELRRSERVGPQVGKELADSGVWALLVVTIGIMVYLAMRFEWRFAVGAIVATFHDVVIVVGCFAAFQWEFSLTVLAAILAILGYSVNDTVVVFDRIRENFRKMRKGAVPEIIDNAITRTLSRTIMTHVTTQIMVFSMMFLGGEILFYFSLALTLGILVGTYSSVLVASPIVMWLGISRENLLPVKKEGAEADSRP